MRAKKLLVSIGILGTLTGGLATAIPLASAAAPATVAAAKPYVYMHA